jgi:Flagellar biosynthesis/type III secretory pathway chaperone
MTQALPGNTQSQVKTLLLELQQDVVDYRRLEGMLREQKTLLIQHDSAGLTLLHQKQTPLLEQLSGRAAARTQLLQKLGLQADDKGMEKLLGKLPAPLSLKANQLWQELHQLLQRCQAHNNWNGRLLAGQMELIHSLLQMPQGYPEPDR